MSLMLKPGLCRTQIPGIEPYVKGVATDELDLEMAMSEEETKSIEEAKVGKIWRALRITARNHLAQIDKIDDGRNLQALLKNEEGVVGVNGASEESVRETTNTKVEMSVADNREDEHQEPRPASHTQAESGLDDAIDGA